MVCGSRPRKVASFGGLNFFIPENQKLADKYGADYFTAWDDPHRVASPFTSVKDLKDNEVSINDPVVTSAVSYNYQQGILIGYISSIETDSNNLTKSGTITPAVDFEHIEEVLVILNKKQTVEN